MHKKSPSDYLRATGGGSSTVPSLPPEDAQATLQIKWTTQKKALYLKQQSQNTLKRWHIYSNKANLLNLDPEK